MSGQGLAVRADVTATAVMMAWSGLSSANLGAKGGAGVSGIAIESSAPVCPASSAKLRTKPVAGHKTAFFAKSRVAVRGATEAAPGVGEGLD
ncbi:MAG: hypothetical protein ABIK37_01710, partial [candidate division WOR-3 bacterium]